MKTKKKLTDIWVIALTEFGGEVYLSYTTDKVLWDWIFDQNPLPPQPSYDKFANDAAFLANYGISKQKFIGTITANPNSGSYENDKAISVQMMQDDWRNGIPVELVDLKSWAKKKGFNVVDIYEGLVY